MKIILRVIAVSLALGALIQGRTLLADLGDWPGFVDWAGSLAAWFVFSELVHVVGGVAGSILLWRLTTSGRIIAIIVNAVDVLHGVVPWLLGPAFGVDHFRLDGSGVFGIVMGVAVVIALLQPAAKALCSTKITSSSMSAGQELPSGHVEAE